MRIVPMFRYSGTNGEVVTAVELPMDCIHISRLIADEGKMITKDGETLYNCLDVEDTEGYYEIDAAEDGDIDGIEP